MRNYSNEQNKTCNYVIPDIYEENSFRKIVIDLLANQNMLSGKNHIKTRFK